MKSKILLFLSLMLCAFSAFSQESADKILGTYRVQSPFGDDVAKVKIAKTKTGTYQGRIVWVNHPTNADGTPRTDEKNANAKLRKRKATDIIMCWNLQYQDGEWVKGVLYDPFSGKNYSIKFKLSKNNKDLAARYYKGVPAAGINATWVKCE